MGFQHVHPFNWRNLGLPDLESVQHGEVSITNGNVSVTDTITAVVKNKSILLFTYTTEEGSEVPHQEITRGVLTNSTTLTFDTDTANSDKINIAWTVIEFKASSHMNVQHFAGTVTGSSNNITLSTIDQAHTFPILTYTVGNTVLDSDNYGGAEISSNTNCILRWSGVSGNKYGLQIVEYDEWDVTAYTDSMAQPDTLENTPITAVDLSETMLFSSCYDDGTGAVATGDQLVTLGFSSTTNIQVYRRVSGHTLDFFHYVVETNGKVLCDHDNNESIGTGSATASWNHTAINWANSAYRNNTGIPSWGNNQTDALSRGEDLAFKLTNTNSTTGLQRRGFTATAVARGSHSVYDFSGS